MPNNIEKALAALQKEVENDTFNLTRNDHEAIATQIATLKAFISSTYDARRKSSGLNE